MFSSSTLLRIDELLLDLVPWDETLSISWRPNPRCCHPPKDHHIAGPLFFVTFFSTQSSYCFFHPTVQSQYFKLSNSQDTGSTIFNLGFSKRVMTCWSFHRCHHSGHDQPLLAPRCATSRRRWSFCILSQLSFTSFLCSSDVFGTFVCFLAINSPQYFIILLFIIK